MIESGLAPPLTLQLFDWDRALGGDDRLGALRVNLADMGGTMKRPTWRRWSRPAADTHDSVELGSTKYSRT